MAPTAPMRLGLAGFEAGLPLELAAATATLGLFLAADPDAPLVLVDARGSISDEVLHRFTERKGIAVVYGVPPESDPVFDAAFDDAIPPGCGEGAVRRRLTLALRLAATIPDRNVRATDDRSDALRLANASLEFALRRFEALFQGLPAACFTMDFGGMIHEWNREATGVLGLQAYEAIYRTSDKVFGPLWTPEGIAERFDRGELAFDWTFRRPDGKRIHLDCRLLAISSEGGERTAVVAANLDVTARVKAQRLADLAARRVERARRKLEAANAVLNSIALTDPLTGLGNRRRFGEILEAARERERRTGVGFALLLLDIDRFKSINDEFGHAAGDEILQALARVLRKSARKLETPARLGGEEFALVLEGCDEGKAMLVAERVRRTMGEWPWPFRVVTASFGIAVSRADETDEELYDRADAALYEAKRGGRDQARLAA